MLKAFKTQGLGLGARIEPSQGRGLPVPQAEQAGNRRIQPALDAGVAEQVFQGDFFVGGGRGPRFPRRFPRPCHRCRRGARSNRCDRRFLRLLWRHLDLALGDQPVDDSRLLVLRGRGRGWGRGRFGFLRRLIGGRLGGGFQAGRHDRRRADFLFRAGRRGGRAGGQDGGQDGHRVHGAEDDGAGDGRRRQTGPRQPAYRARPQPALRRRGQELPAQDLVGRGAGQGLIDARFPARISAEQ